MIKKSFTKTYAPAFLAGIAAMLAIFGFTVILKIKVPDQAWNWFISLVSTVVSVLLGLAIAIWLFIYQSRITERDNRQKQHGLIDTELAAMWEALNTVTNPMNVNTGKEKFTFHVVFMQTLALEDGAGSGLFDAEQTQMMFKLRRWMAAHNRNLELFLSLVADLPQDAMRMQMLRILHRSHNDTRRKLIKDISVAGTEMELPSLLGRISKFPAITI